MPTPANANLTIEAATALLTEELPQLEAHQQSLEKDLAAVTERLESVRSALSALQALSATTVPMPQVEAEPDFETADADKPSGRKSVAAVATPDTGGEEPSSAPEAEQPLAPAAETKPRRRPASRKKTASKKAPAKTAAKTRRTKNTASSAKASPAQKAKGEAPSPVEAAGLTDQVAAVLARHAAAPMRAREVAQILGRDESAGAINTVRSTLDRLVATSRAHRAGRGLYQAPGN
ncbi:hypothetical protein ACWGH4_06245 [Streptomyces sp. NPDC054847]